MMTDTPPADRKIFNKTINIHASTSEVWQALTIPERMNQWMMPDAKIDILTEWKVGGPIAIRGRMNEKDFKNSGTVLRFEPEKALAYTHLSSISRLPDRAESHSTIDFRLTQAGDGTILELTLSNFPTESIYKHLAFYWNVTLEILKRTVEMKNL
jgi:uncharacterized protein YndB with AHSA1/START domain